MKILKLLIIVIVLSGCANKYRLTVGKPVNPTTKQLQCTKIKQ